MASKCEIKRKKQERLRVQHTIHLRQLKADKGYRESLKWILDKMDLWDQYCKLPEKEKKCIDSLRMHSPKLIPAKGVKVSSRKLEALQRFLSLFLKDDFVPILEGECKIPLHVYLTSFMTLYNYVLVSKRTINSSKFLQCLQQIMDDFNRMQDAHCHLAGCLQAIEAYHSRINQSMYYVKPEFYMDYISNKKSAFTITLYQVKAITRDFTIDSRKRPAYRVGWPEFSVGIKWYTLTARDFGQNHPFADLPLDVYIQSHALIRLRERIDTILHIFLHMQTAQAVSEKEITCVMDNRILIAYRYQGYKLGYFLAEIVDGYVVIKTFLFITNTGTPEGDKLDKELGTNKLLKDFLSIDKLSTFVHSDIRNNEIIKTALAKAGLEHLCNLPDDFSNPDTNIVKNYAASFIKYTGLDSRISVKDELVATTY